MSNKNDSRARLAGNIFAITVCPFITIGALFLWVKIPSFGLFNDHWFGNIAYPIIAHLPLVAGAILGWRSLARRRGKPKYYVVAVSLAALLNVVLLLLLFLLFTTTETAMPFIYAITWN